jgi:hypothetical protein
MAYMCIKRCNSECTGCGDCQPIAETCECCGDEIDGVVYTDEKYDKLCEECLLELHKV